MFSGETPVCHYVNTEVFIHNIAIKIFCDDVIYVMTDGARMGFFEVTFEFFHAFGNNVTKSLFRIFR